MAYTSQRYDYDDDYYRDRGTNWLAVLLVPILVLGALYVGYKVLTNNGTNRNLLGFTPTVAPQNQNNSNNGGSNNGSSTVAKNNGNVGVGTTSYQTTTRQTPVQVL
jgi:uncharacterized membrane protein